MVSRIPKSRKRAAIVAKEDRLKLKEAIARLSWLRNLTPVEMIESRLSPLEVHTEIVKCNKVILNYKSTFGKV